MGVFGRLATDPPSVPHEGDWGFWNWTGAVVLLVIATGAVMIGCIAVSQVVASIKRQSEPDSVFWLGIGVAFALPAGLVALCWAIHGMARHTASNAGAAILIMAVYGLSLASVWLLGSWAKARTYGSARVWDCWEDEWARTLKVVGVIYVILAVCSLGLEALNKVSASLGIAISVIVVVMIGGVVIMALNAGRR